MEPSLTIEDEIASDNRDSADLLQYQELQKQRRAKKKNFAVWSKTGQPDTPRQRLGKHYMSVPSNSSSFAYDDEDLNDEDWALGGPSQLGSSRARLSDSRNSMWRKYSRTAGSSHSRDSREFSFTGLSLVKLSVIMCPSLPLSESTNEIDEFQVAFCLCFKARSSGYEN